MLAVAVVTAASFYLNAVFAYAITGPSPPVIRPAFTKARSRRAVILGSGFFVGLLLGLSTMVVVRWGTFWFGLCLSTVIAVMMICYIAVPARLIGMKSSASRRDKVTAAAVGGVVSTIVCTPPYLLGRLGLVMLGSDAWLIPGVLVLIVGLMLHAGATSAVKTIKMGAKLLTGHSRHERSGNRPDGPGLDAG